MAYFKTVFDFIKSVPDALRHEEIYRSKVELASSYSEQIDINMSLWEASTIGIGENNLLRDLPIADKFGYPGMDKELKVVSTTMAKSSGETVGKGSLGGKRIYSETFLLETSLQLRTLVTRAESSHRRGIEIPRNIPLFAEITSSLSGITALTLASPAVGALSEMLVIRQDLRHIFVKGYLMLMSYNLAVTSGITDYQYCNMGVDIRCSVNSEEKLAIMLAYPLVVDAAHFTKEELWVLIEMCCSYPKKKYVNETIYSNISLEGDQLCIITKEESIKLGSNPGFGSPERLWKDIFSIALKMDALEDLREVVRDMRGVPALLRSVASVTGKTSFAIRYPPSYSITLAIDDIVLRTPNISRDSGYYATSKCLVVDLLLGKMMEMSAFNLIEDLAALGVLGCPNREAIESSLLNGNLRGRGLRQEDESRNELLQEWRGVRGSSMKIGFSGILKDYVLRMAANIRAGNVSNLRPQLLFALPYSRCVNTTWSTIRGWRFPEFNFSSELEMRVRQNQLDKAFTWVMGASNDVPKISKNGFGERTLQGMSQREMKLLGMASGGYNITLVRLMLDKELEPRVDEYETGMTNFYNTSFPGIRCSIVYDFSGKASVVQERKFDYGYQRASVGIIADKDDEYLTAGGSYVPPRKKNADVDRTSNLVGVRDKDHTEVLVDDMSRGTRKEGGRKVRWGDEVERTLPTPTPTPHSQIGTEGRNTRAPLNRGAGEYEPVLQEISPTRPSGRESEGGGGRGGPRQGGQGGRGNGNRSEGQGRQPKYPYGMPPEYWHRYDKDGNLTDLGRDLMEREARERAAQQEQQDQQVQRDKELPPPLQKEPMRQKQHEVIIGDVDVSHNVNKQMADRERIVDVEGLLEQGHVVGQKRGPLTLVGTPHIEYERGQPVTKEVTLADGGVADIAVKPSTDPVTGGSIRGYRLRTPGDGTCGVHALVKDLVLKGYVQESETSEAYRNFMNVAVDSGWHDAKDLAVILNSIGMGLVVLEPDASAVHEYGTVDSINNVHVVLRQGHFETFIPSEKGNEIIHFNHRREIPVTPPQFLQAMMRLPAAFGGDYYNARIAPRIAKRIERLRASGIADTGGEGTPTSGGSGGDGQGHRSEALPKLGPGGGERSSNKPRSPGPGNSSNRGGRGRSRGTHPNRGGGNQNSGRGGGTPGRGGGNTPWRY